MLFWYYLYSMKHTVPATVLLFAVLGFLIFPAGCAPLYFQTLKPPAESLRFSTPGDLPYRELWSGFVFNGEKIGFTVLKITPLPERNLYRISSEARMRFLFMGLDKRIIMKSEDTVRPDLTLVSFHYEHDMDGKPLVMDGNVSDGRFHAEQASGGKKKTLDLRIDGPLYPTSAINLYPVLRGITVGSTYRYPVFDPQTQSIAEVTQKAAAFESSSKLMIEPAFRVETRLHEHEASAWINMRGETVFELGMGGILITYKEEEARARQYLSEASLNKKDLLLDFSLIKTEKPLPCPREARHMEAAIEGVSGQLPLLRGPGQEVAEKKDGGKNIALYRVTSAPLPPPESAAGELSPAERLLYLSPTHHIEAAHPEILKTADGITAGAVTPREKADRLRDWVAREVKDEAVDSFSALEVLHTRKGECQAHAMLYTALARAAGIPTKLVGGLVYMEGMGFLYHSWVESWLEGWTALDPTFNQPAADATHIKLAEGPDWLSVLQLGKVVGRLRLTVLDYKAACPDKTRP
jgi:hypothetical protein